MSEEDGRGRAVTDPTELWRQWFETGTKAWSDLFEAGRKNYADPYGLYRQWFVGLEEMRERMIAGPQLKAPGGATGMEGKSPVEKARPVPAANPLANVGLEGTQDLWRQWFEAVNKSAQRSVSLGTEVAQMWPRWVEMFDQIRTNFAAVENVPTDPLQFATQWYNATNGPFSDLVGDLIEREEFLEPFSRLLQNYASFYKVFKRNSEEYLKSLQLPVRSDVSRVAGLVVALEEKVDGLEEDFEDFEDRLGEPATTGAVAGIEERIVGLEVKLDASAEASAEAADGAAAADSVANLERRLDGVEEKLDRLLAALESAPQNGGVSAGLEPALYEAPQEPLQPNGASSQAAAEPRATAAARRKAQELGVDLGEVEGTGSGGQITVDDVRRKGAS